MTMKVRANTQIIPGSVTNIELSDSINISN